MRAALPIARRQRRLFSSISLADDIQRQCDFLVLGGGIAGVSAAYNIINREKTARVILLEREPQLAYHASGRSAAIYIESYGSAANRALSAASLEFLLKPPSHFASELLRPRGFVYFGAGDTQRAAIDDVFQRQLREEHMRSQASRRIKQSSPRMVKGDELQELCLFLKPSAAECGLYEPGAMDMDVASIHGGYAAHLSQSRPASVVRGVGDVETAQWDSVKERWHVTTANRGVFDAAIVVNASGAWADEVGQRFGARKINLQPRRRTIIGFAAPSSVKPQVLNRLPFTNCIDESLYLKHEAGLILASPANVDLTVPHDVSPEELDVALAVHRVEEMTTLTVPAVKTKWAGLRSFASDGNFVMGYDPKAPSFFWLAGQGGVGFQTAPAAAELAAALALGVPVPAHITNTGIDLEDISPARPALDIAPRADDADAEEENKAQFG